jgi:pseudaminic acid cytidylyltransferase
MNKAVCIIPARGGSKRIPKKNIKKFLGKPLIAYSIEVALESELFDKVIVSTDDEEIAQIAKEYGAEVPFNRPKEISDDYASSGDAVAHAIEFLKKRGERFDFVCTIYATAPLLQKEYLIEGFEKLKTSNAAMSFSVTSMPFPIQRSFKITPEGRCKMFTPEHFYDRSQDLEEAYQDAGQFYWQNLNITLSDLPFGGESIPVILPRHLVQDIDTLEDWERAEKLYLLHKIDQNNKWDQIKKFIDFTSSEGEEDRPTRAK